MFFPKGELKLFNLNLSASLFEGGLESLSFCLGYFLLKDCVRSLVNQLLGFLKTKTGSFLDRLYDLEFSLAGGLEDNSEFCLLSLYSCRCRACYCYLCYCRLDAVLFLEYLCEFLNLFYSEVYQLFCKNFDVCHNVL